MLCSPSPPLPGSIRFHHLLLCLLSISSTAYSDGTVQLDHRDGSVTPFQTVELSKGDNLFVQIVNTEITCTEYSVSAQVPPDTNRERLKTTEKKLTIKHDGKATAYQVNATRMATAAATCPLLPNRVWTLPVFTHRWNLGFAGAFTVDTLTDRVYFLAPGSNNGAQGFFVRRNTSNEDHVSLGAAAMVHVYHTDWGTFAHDIGFVPLSFGLGIGTAAETRYYLGTGVRFGDQFFLTLGGVFGSARRLPDSLTEGAFTTDANALASPPKGRGQSFFVSLSYAFLGSAAKAALQAPFVSSTAPSGGQPQNPTVPQISAVSWADKPNGVAAISGSGFSTDKTSIAVSVDNDAATIATATDTKLDVTIPVPDRTKASLSVTVTVAGTKGKAYAWDTTK
jgi:IPT/TIG domain